MNPTKHYFIETQKQLKEYLTHYVPLVKIVAKSFNIDLSKKRFMCDHVGLQAISKENFDDCDFHIQKYANLTKDGRIHNRRNRLYVLYKPIVIDDIKIVSIETFEPKPNADMSKLRLGIEHIAFVVSNYEEFYQECLNKNIPIEKRVDFGDKTSFFKTKFINGVEIEFRTEALN